MHQWCSSPPWFRQFTCTNMAVQRTWLMGMTQGNSGALMRQLRITTLGSLDALNATIHVEHTRIFTVFGFLFYHGGNFSLYWAKLTLNKREVQLQQTKKLFVVKVPFEQNRSSATHSKKFNCMWEAVQVLCFFRGEILPIKIIFISHSCTSKPHRSLIYNYMSLLSLIHDAMPHSTTIAMPNSNRSHISLVSNV
jgi:hypothetical protein